MPLVACMRSTPQAISTPLDAGSASRAHSQSTGARSSHHKLVLADHMGWNVLGLLHPTHLLIDATAPAWAAVFFCQSRAHRCGFHEMTQQHDNRPTTERIVLWMIALSFLQRLSSPRVSRSHEPSSEHSLLCRSGAMVATVGFNRFGQRHKLGSRDGPCPARRPLRTICVLLPQFIDFRSISTTFAPG